MFNLANVSYYINYNISYHINSDIYLSMTMMRYVFIVISKKTDKSIEGLAWFKNKYVMILDYMKLSGNDVLKWREVLLKKKLG